MDRCVSEQVCDGYLQGALLSSLLVEALHDFAVDAQPQHLGGDGVVIRHRVSPQLQF